MRKLLISVILLLSWAAASAQGGLFGSENYNACATRGNMFSESMGNENTGTAACADGSTTCTQAWMMNEGSGASIVAAPYAGFNCPKVMKLAANSTHVIITSLGTLQNVPSGSTSDVYVEWAYDSTSASGEGIIQLNYPGSSLAYNFVLVSGGQCWFANDGNNHPCSVGARHLLHVHLAGSSSYDQIDNGTHYTFTAPSQNWYQLVLGGDGVSNLYYGNVWINNSSYHPCLPAPMVLFDGATGDLTVGTHGGNGAWGESTLTNISFAFGSASPTFSSPTNVCGISYQGNGETAVATLTPAASVGGYLALSEDTAATGARIGFGWSYSETATNTGVDFFGLADQDGAIDNVQLNNIGGNDEICFENDIPDSPAACIPYTVHQNTNYWVTFGVSPTGDDTAYLYSYPDMTFLSSEHVGNMDRAFVGPQLFAQMGKGGSETVANSMTMTYFNVLLDLSTGHGPLLPAH